MKIQRLAIAYQILKGFQDSMLSLGSALTAAPTAAGYQVLRGAPLSIDNGHKTVIFHVDSEVWLKTVIVVIDKFFKPSHYDLIVALKLEYWEVSAPAKKKYKIEVELKTLLMRII